MYDHEDRISNAIWYAEMYEEEEASVRISDNEDYQKLLTILHNMGYKDTHLTGLSKNCYLHFKL